MSGYLLSAPLVGLVATLVPGCFLFVYGLRGRRVGDEPHCRKCNYNLTGLPSQQCPECGTDVSGKNVVIGRRRRRWRALVPALLLLLVSITGLGLGAYGQAKGINWYAYLPTFVLLQQAKVDVAPAIAELAQRCSAGDVRAERPLDLIPLGLARQGTDPRPRSVWAWTDLRRPWRITQRVLS